MNWYIHQTIMIQHLKVDSVSNSSVLQIGTAGSIRSLSNLYNTGGFVEPTPQLGTSTTNPVSLVPLPPPT
ncbi:spore germination protein GerPB [Paenibacillus alba]|uniref:Spore germination protein GerPB n=1 Tax=Paenibacillus alba TaxID=1197127 RepID=A0ABU6FVQ2_9BACL|nr:spore germination protein GerPB [Paenibacillus alba]MEC0225980.1 spore germination protein GerPB [Paenibacillus alba]NQX71509.1 spore gernimation protein [Paenibacillus alba]